MSNDLLLSYISTLQKLLLYMNDDLLLIAEPSHGLEEEEDDEEASSSPGAMPSSPSRQKTLDPRLQKWLAVLVDPGHLNTIAHFICDDPAMASTKNVQVVASFLTTLFTRWHAKKASILNTLILRSGASLVAAFWSAVKGTRLWAALTSGRVQAALTSDPDMASDWPVLTTIAEVLSKQLQTIGDDEFYGGKLPLTMSEMADICRALNLVAFSLFWNDLSESKMPVIGTAIRLDHMTQLFTRILQQLHARDSRRPFCPPGHWLMSEYIDITSFVESAVAEDEVVAQSKKGLGPRQKILNNIPFVIPFDVRVEIFREWIGQDRVRNGLDTQWIAPAARVEIRRHKVFEDGYAQLNGLGSGLKKRVAITFISEQGLMEAGIDGGGVFKEFLTSLSRQAFDANYGLFQTTKDQLLYPSSHIYATFDTQLNYLEFLGRIMGKALYEGVLVDAAFAGFFLSKWLGRQSYLDDLQSLDPELYQGLIFIKHYDGDLKDLALTFSVDDDVFGTSRTVDLIPNGSQVPVTNENRIRYIYLVANYRLNIQIERQTRAFFRGLSDLIDPKWLRMFNQQELQMLIGGTTSPIDIRDLRQNTVYGGGFDESHPTVQAFWEVVERFDEDEKAKLVKFVTSCARPPLMGFKELRPAFSVRNAGGEVDRLPTASTCVNLLKLPAYQSSSVLKEKLLYAINAGAGFELS
ncbi:hypothetical protein HDV00_005035 [Rhizophlyctis rosea]|nr:hypothetical protein HDV00_005035 [Rhizophlyctis rosea]